VASKRLLMADNKELTSPRKPTGKGDDKRIPCVINDVDLTHTLPTPLWVTFGEKEKNAIAEFKTLVESYIRPNHSDYYFSRFLVARKWDMKLATELFVNAMKVREAEDVDNILETFPKCHWYKTLCAYWPTSISPDRFHTAKDGCPVMYERIGLVSPKLADLVPMDILIRHHLYNVEIMEAENRKIVEKHGFSAGTILIEDLEDLGTSHMVGKITKLITSISARDEISYPESIRKVYIVNPPSIFHLVWAIMKPFIEERTQQKFSFGTVSAFAKEWDLIIGKENLPKYLGGTLDWTPPVGGNIKPITPSSLIEIEVPRKAHHILEISATKGSLLHVEFLCKNKEIGFGLYIKTTKESLTKASEINHTNTTPIEKYKLAKYEDEITPYHVEHKVEEDATFIAYFDNRDSFMMARDLVIHHYFT